MEALDDIVQMLGNDDVIQILSNMTKIKKLEYSDIHYKPSLKLSNASIGQIMACFVVLHGSEFKPKNEYEVKFSENICAILEPILDKYESMLHNCQTEEDTTIRKFILVFDLPNDTVINNKNHSKIILKKPPIGQLINATKLRIQYILDRQKPSYITNEEMEKSYNKLREEFIDFNALFLEFEIEFKKLIAFCKEN